MHLIFASMLSTFVHLTLVGLVHSGNGGVHYLTSPNYPNYYPNNQHIRQTMLVENGASIKVTFIDFQVESHRQCVWDYVKICDRNGKCGGKMCGATLPETLTVETSIATVLFYSDYSVTRKGFKLSYQAVCTTDAVNSAACFCKGPTSGSGEACVAKQKCNTNGTCQDACHEKIYLNQAKLIQIASPGYTEGRNYPNNVNCSWTLISPPSEKVSLSMLYIDTEYGYDIIKVFDGEKVKDKVLAIISGTDGQNNKNKDIIISSGEVMKITFLSNMHKNMAGFNASVSTIIKTDLPIFSWADKSDMKFKIVFPNKNGAVIEFIQLRRVPDMDPACIFEGSTTNTHVVIASSSSYYDCQSFDQHVEILVNSIFLPEENAKYSILGGQLKEITEIFFENNVLISQNNGGSRQREMKTHAPLPAKIEIWIQIAFDIGLKHKFEHHGSGVSQIKKRIKEIFSFAQDFFKQLDTKTTIKLLLVDDIIHINEGLTMTEENLKRVRKYQKDPTIPLIVICAENVKADNTVSPTKGLSFRSGACRENDAKRYGVALVAYRDETVQAREVLIHELLHLFGMDHDENNQMDTDLIDSWYNNLGRRCYDRSCPDPSLHSTKANGKWECDGDNKMCSFKCNPGFISVFSTIECQNGQWSQTINDVACTPSVFLVVGGGNIYYGNTGNYVNTIEVYHPIVGNPTCSNPLPPLSNPWTSQVMFKYTDTIYICGGLYTPSMCRSFNMQHNKWKSHKISPRRSHSAVVIKDTVYFVGGYWDPGHPIPMPVSTSLPLTKNPIMIPIPNLDYKGSGTCVVKIDEDNFVIIGGQIMYKASMTNVIKYSTVDKLPMTQPPLQQGRTSHACIIIEKDNRKWIVVTGGIYVSGNGTDPEQRLKTTEIFNLNENTWEALGDLQRERSNHEIISTEKGVLVIGGQEISGHTSLDSVEVLQWTTKKWETAQKSLVKGRYSYGLLEIPSFMLDCNLNNEETECTKENPLAKENGKWLCDADYKTCFLKCLPGFVSLYTTTTCVEGTWKGINKMECLLSMYFIAGGTGTYGALEAGGVEAEKNIEFYHPNGIINCFNYMPALDLKWSAHTTFKHQNTIYICGGQYTQSICISTDHEDYSWRIHTLSRPRKYSSSVVMKDIVYFIGGYHYTGYSMWTTLPLTENPVMTQIPNLASVGNCNCVVKMDQNSFVIIAKNVIKYNVNDKTSTSLTQLQEHRCGHACAVVEKEENEWIIVTGGSNYNLNTEAQGTTEIYDAKKSTWKPMGKLNRKRKYHDMIHSEQGIMVIGGHFSSYTPENSVELLHWDTKKWEEVQPSLITRRTYFGGAVEIPISLFGCQTYTEDLNECEGDYEFNKEYVGGDVTIVPEKETCHSMCQKIENCITWTCTKAEGCRIQTSVGAMQEKIGSVSGKKNACKPKCYLISDGQDVMKTNTEFCNEKNTETDCEKMIQMEATNFEKQQHEGRILICYEVEGENVCEHINYKAVDLLCSDEPAIVTLTTFQKINDHRYVINLTPIFIWWKK